MAAGIRQQERACDQILGGIFLHKVPEVARIANEEIAVNAVQYVVNLRFIVPTAVYQ